MTSRALRIGMVIGDTLVEERIVTGTRPITVGQSLRCTFSVPVDGAPREHALFVHDGERFALCAPDGTQTPLATGARGKVRFGDATILYQEVARPVAAPRPQLPASIRGTLADRIDRRLAMIVGGSLVVHIAIAAWAWSTEVDDRPLLAPPVAQQFEQATIDVMLPPEASAPAPSHAGVAAPVVPAHAITPVPRPIAHAPAPLSPPTLRPEDAQRFASMLTSDETAPGGPARMNAHHPGSALDQELEDLRAHHQTVAIGNDHHGFRAHDETAISPTDHALPLDQATHSTLDATEERGHVPRIPPTDIHTDEPTTLTPQAVLDKVNALYLRGLERCYKKSLATEPSLSGRVVLSFTVSETGKVTEPDAAGSDAQLDRCISSQMSGWRFAIPHDRSGAPTEATFHVSLALQPT